MDEKKIVFIGNSYTFYNDMPEALFSPMMEEAGWSISVRRLTKGGQFLIDSADETNVLGAKVDAALKEERFDLAIIQEQSTCPVLTPEKFCDGVRSILKKIRQNGATPYLYGTWGRKTGSPFLEKEGLTAEEMTKKLVAEQKKICHEEKISPVFVGEAFLFVTETYPEIELYREDCSHPSLAGSFLAALCLTAVLTGVDPTTLSFRGELEERVAKALKEAAKTAVFQKSEKDA